MGAKEETSTDDEPPARNTCRQIGAYDTNPTGLFTFFFFGFSAECTERVSICIISQVTSEDVVQAYIDRCKEVNPLVNAIVEDRFEDALIEARQIDAEIAKGTKTIEEMERDTPLLGLPVTVKGNYLLFWIFFLYIR